jgi:hypothetical protein
MRIDKSVSSAWVYHMKVEDADLYSGVSQQGRIDLDRFTMWWTTGGNDQSCIRIVATAIIECINIHVGYNIGAFIIAYTYIILHIGSQ